MTVFKAFLKIVKKNKGLIILYTAMLIIFAGSNMSTNDNNTNYVSSKPVIKVVDKDNGIIFIFTAGYAKIIILGNFCPLINNIYINDKIKFPPAESPNNIKLFILIFKSFSPFSINQL